MDAFEKLTTDRFFSDGTLLERLHDEFTIVQHLAHKHSPAPKTKEEIILIKPKNRQQVAQITILDRAEKLQAAIFPQKGAKFVLTQDKATAVVHVSGSVLPTLLPEPDHYVPVHEEVQQSDSNSDPKVGLIAMRYVLHEASLLMQNNQAVVAVVPLSPNTI